MEVLHGWMSEQLEEKRVEPNSGLGQAIQYMLMRVIAVIDDPGVVQKILRHLGAWHDPPASPPTHCPPGPYTYEPCDDVDPMPDYENVLTD